MFQAGRGADGFGGGAGGFPVSRARKLFASMDWKKSPRGFAAASGAGEAGPGPSRSARLSSTVWYTASNTAFSWANFTWVLAGCTFTSTAVTGRVTASTQPGKRPFMIWFR